MIRKLYQHILVILIFCYFFQSIYATTTNEDDFETTVDRYSPTVFVKITPDNPHPESNVTIYAKIFDKYGKMPNTILSYSIDGGASWNHTTMKLWDGIPSNGTFFEIIPIQPANTIVNYTINIHDEIGYSKSIIGNYIVLKDLDRPWVQPPSIRAEEANIDISIGDFASGVKNATFHYDSSISPGNYHTIKMNLSEGDKWFGTWTAFLQPFKVGTNGSFFIETYDYAGNFLPLNGSFIAELPWWRNSTILNKFNIIPQVVRLDSKNLTADIKIDITSESVNASSILGQEIERPYIRIEGVNNADNQNFKNAKDFFVIILNASKAIGTGPYPKKIPENTPFVALSDMYTFVDTYMLKDMPKGNNEVAQSTTFSLIGDPLKYPFDSYHINLLFAIPIKGVEESDYHISILDRYINASWDPSKSNIAELYHTNTAINNLYRDCEIIEKKWDRLFGGELCQIKNNGNSNTGSAEQERGDTSFFNIYLDFKRNYTIAIVAVPLLAIFYLLGAIFTFDFESAIDLIGTRLALTLGIFALIFTLPEVINSMKPQTSGHTIADSMLSVIILATIAFTISSAISSSSVIRNWFPRYYAWIDVIVFLIVSGIVVAYFSNFLFDPTIWWLVPVILFGLGYGLLLRLLGIKITKPIFARRKKTTITKV